MKKPLTDDQRGRVAEKIMEWGNLSFAGLVIARGIGAPVDPLAIIAGIGALILAYVVADRLMRGGGL